MKSENMRKLVRYLSEFIKTGDFLYSPLNVQYSWYIDLFLDENKDGKSLPIGRFSDQLGWRLIAEEHIQELDGNDANYNPDTPQQNRYTLFFNTWSSWTILYDELKKRGRLNS